MKSWFLLRLKHHKPSPLPLSFHNSNSPKALSVRKEVTMKQQSYYNGHFSGYICGACFRRLPRSVFYLPLEARYLEFCRSCTQIQQKKRNVAKAA